MIGSVRTDSSVLMDTRLAAVSLSCRNRVENIVVAAATGAAISTMQAKPLRARSFSLHFCLTGWK